MDFNNRQLSDRERTVLLLAADGLTDKEIARRLSLSQRTVGTYWERMREKIGPHSRTQLVARFFNNSSNDDASTTYRNLFASWEQGVWIIRNDGVTVYANHRIPELFELTPGQFESTNAAHLIEQVTSISFNDMLVAAKADQRQVEFTVTRPDRSKVWISMHISAVSSARQQPEGTMVLRLSDVSVQRRVKHALESCESTLDFISNHVAELVARFDVNLNCVFANRAYKAAIGEDAVGKHLGDLSDSFRPPEVWAENLRETIASGKMREFEAICPSTSGKLQIHLLPVPSESGEVTEVLSVSSRSAL